MYTTYSMVTNLLVNIAIGILILLILSVVVITIMFWFNSPPEQMALAIVPHEAHHRVLDPEGLGIPMEQNLAMVLKILISFEGAAYIVVNMKMLKKWVRMEIRMSFLIIFAGPALPRIKVTLSPCIVIEICFLTFF